MLKSNIYKYIFICWSYSNAFSASISVPMKSHDCVGWSQGHHRQSTLTDITPNAVATMLENKTKIMSRQESSQLLLLQLQQLGLAFSYFFKALLLALLLLWKPSTFGTKKKKIDFALFLKQKFSRNLFCKKIERRRCERIFVDEKDVWTAVGSLPRSWF